MSFPARSTAAMLAIGVLFPAAARAQTPPAGPVVLQLPSSARTAALGSAWVAGRDHDVIFYNPAQLINARPGIDLSLTRYGPGRNTKSIASTYAGGKWSLTLGWGVQLFDEPVAGTSALLVVGGAAVYKGFRIGAAGKYVSDAAAGGSTARDQSSAVLADVGVARNVLGGVAAFALQNLGGGSADDDVPDLVVPRQYVYGWSMTRAAGPLDLGVFTQMTHRDGWNAPGAGLEAGYTWIEGYTVVVRAGARRQERDSQRPFTLGAGLTADRLTIEYAVQFFDAGRTANGVTLRWR